MQRPGIRPRAGSGDAGSAQFHSVRHVVAQLEMRSCGDSVSLHDLIETGGTASFVPALMVPALLVVSPLSGVPLFSTLSGIAIALISVQMLWQRDRPALPAFLARRKIPARRLRGAFGPMRKAADFLDRHTRADRLRRLVGRRGRVLPQTLCVVAGATMPVLELVPFASSILGAAVLCFAVALLTRDGLFAVFGMTIMAAAALVPFVVLNGL